MVCVCVFVCVERPHKIRKREKSEWHVVEIIDHAGLAIFTIFGNAGYK
jgi:hypothetical protein